MRDIISRFAPAPTGFLHLGHVVNAVYVWRETIARARSAGVEPGRVLLRIEDHDRQRSGKRFEEEILDDLAWLGFVADEGPVRQSERGAIYQDALERLRRQGLVYACRCSRTEIAEGARAVVDSGKGARAFDAQEKGARAFDAQEKGARAFQASGDASNVELRYPGTCAERGLADAPGLGLRVRLAPSIERFVDLRHGPQEQRPSEQCGDLLVRDRDGNWTYQFAATVDDFVQGVTLVVRGDDLLASTGRQIQLARLLGRDEPPVFLHHALIMKSAASAGGFGAPSQKLSKSDGATGIRELRARGWTPADVIAAAMAAVGR
jgi:glutamyl/glutaminyl-tRNA synthetase